MRTKFIASAALGVSLPMFAVAEAPSVAVDIAPLHSLVSQVMEGVEEPALLIPAEASPHSYSLRPSQAKALSEADVVFWMGESLTPWLEKAIDNVADSSQKIEMLELASTTKHEFREGATFEGHDHHEEEEGHHDEHEEEGHHDKHEEHHSEKHHDEHEEHSFIDRVLAFFGDDHEHEDEHHNHDKKGHGFEWAGAFELDAGDYIWTFAKVDGHYADPKMKMIFIASDASGKNAIESSEKTAEALLDVSNSIRRTDGQKLTPDNSKAYNLVFDQSKDVTEYRINIDKSGTYTFFTEHMPFEFEADEHFLKNTSKLDIEPVSQLPEEGHAHHHDHEGADPHAWLDPENAKAWIVEIEKTLSKQDPENAATYAKNADKATANLDKLILETRSQVEALGELKYIVFHDAYQYFEKRFDISAAGSISLGDAEDPSPARIAEIRNTVKTLGVNCVFTEPQYNAGLVENVFEGSTISAIGVMDPLGASIEEGSQHYALLIQGMVKSLSQCNK